MALEAWWSKTPKELVELRHSLSAGTPDAITVDRMLELHFARGATEGNEKLVMATDRLVNVTNRLGRATWVLGAMTLLLVIAACIQAYPIFRKEDAGLRIRRECEAIMREAAAYSRSTDDSIDQSTYEGGVLSCLVESATKGRL